MKQILIAFGAGLLFALGLGISGMTQPAKVIAFLDVTGAWDPSLGFVMAGAIGASIIPFALIMRRGLPLFGDKLSFPVAEKIDAKLLGGAALFGVGWGASGWCPGPAIVSLATGSRSLALFMIGMFGGMALYRVTARSRLGTARVAERERVDGLVEE